MNNVKVALSDSRVLFRKGIRFVLSGEEGFNIIGETNNNSNLYDILLDDPPDVVFVGMTDNWQKDLNLIYHIRRNLPSVSVILVLHEDGVDKIASAIACGISAYITINTDGVSILDTVKSVMQGDLPIIDTMLIPDVASEVYKNFSWIRKLRSELRAYLMQLSPRETEILTGISSGMKIDQVARTLNSDKNAVINTVKSIRSKYIANYISRLLVENAQQNVFPIL